MWTHVDIRGGRKLDFRLDVINGWPLSVGLARFLHGTINGVQLVHSNRRSVKDLTRTGSRPNYCYIKPEYLYTQVDDKTMKWSNFHQLTVSLPPNNIKIK